MDNVAHDLKFTSIGVSQPRVDGFEKAVGGAQFIDDLNLGRVYHAAGGASNPTACVYPGFED